jgi:hypothetical protein
VQGVHKHVTTLLPTMPAVRYVVTVDDPDLRALHVLDVEADTADEAKRIAVEDVYAYEAKYAPHTMLGDDSNRQKLMDSTIEFYAKAVLCERPEQ